MQFLILNYMCLLLYLNPFWHLEFGSLTVCRKNLKAASQLLVNDTWHCCILLVLTLVGVPRVGMSTNSKELDVRLTDCFIVIN